MVQFVPYVFLEFPMKSHLNEILFLVCFCKEIWPQFVLSYSQIFIFDCRYSSIISTLNCVRFLVSSDVLFKFLVYMCVFSILKLGYVAFCVFSTLFQFFQCCQMWFHHNAKSKYRFVLFMYTGKWSWRWIILDRLKFTLYIVHNLCWRL